MKEVIGKCKNCKADVIEFWGAVYHVDLSKAASTGKAMDIEFLKVGNDSCNRPEF